MSREKRKCKNCGAEFSTSHQEKLFCWHGCAKEYHRKKAIGEKRWLKARPSKQMQNLYFILKNLKPEQRLHVYETLKKEFGAKA
jgi:hypothetical protein